MNQLNN